MGEEGKTYRLLVGYNGNFNGMHVSYPAGYDVDGELGVHIASNHPDWVQEVTPEPKAAPVKPELSDGPPATTSKRRSRTRAK